MYKELQGHMAIPCLVFAELSVLFSMEAALDQEGKGVLLSTSSALSLDKAWV